MTQDATQTYVEQGFLTGIDLFSASEINHFRACFDELEARARLKELSEELTGIRCRLGRCESVEGS